jgi:hypothetical protein
MASTPISVSKLTDTPWRACLFAGLLLLILAATGTVFNTSLRLEHPELLYPIFGIGALLTFVPAAVVFLDARRPELGATIKDTSIAKDYAATIESPKDQEVIIPVIIAGTLKKKLPNHLHLWLINHGTENGIVAFWPHTEAVPTEKKWTVTYNPREFDHLATRRLQMFVVSDEGQKLFNYFKQANQYHTKGAALHWPGILQRPSDMIAVSSEILIKLRKAPTT